MIAGLNDLKRPADKLSVGQCGSLAATGLIWSRYSLVITPKNYGLFSVNVFVAMIQLFQMYRIYTFEKPIQRALDAPETPLAIKAAPVLKK